jgi:hypothetical protein
MSLNQVIEGWKNHLLPEERNRTFIEYVANKRMSICKECMHHSKNHKTLRPDAHCISCGCTLAAKTKCLTCECPIKKWMATDIPEEYETT